MGENSDPETAERVRVASGNQELMNTTVPYEDLAMIKWSKPEVNIIRIKKSMLESYDISSMTAVLFILEL